LLFDFLNLDAVVAVPFIILERLLRELAGFLQQGLGVYGHRCAFYIFGGSLNNVRMEPAHHIDSFSAHCHLSLL
jgi:hypothetical protein